VCDALVLRGLAWLLLSLLAGWRLHPSAWWTTYWSRHHIKLVLCAAATCACSQRQKHCVSLDQAV